MAETQALVDEARPDLIILDLMLPDGNGLVLCAELRKKVDVPIIICSATKRRDDRIIGFKLGADDFVAKPPDIDDLLARVEAALRRAERRRPVGPTPAPLCERVGDLTVDHARCQVTLGGQELHLTPTEYRLLCVLVSRPNELLTREELAQCVWGSHDPSVDRSLDVHMRRLRAKLNAGPVPAPPLVTLRGFGYKLVHTPQSAVA